MIPFVVNTAVRGECSSSNVNKSGNIDSFCAVENKIDSAVSPLVKAKDNLRVDAAPTRGETSFIFNELASRANVGRSTDPDNTTLGFFQLPSCVPCGGQ